MSSILSGPTIPVSANLTLLFPVLILIVRGLLQFLSDFLGNDEDALILLPGFFISVLVFSINIFGVLFGSFAISFVLGSLCLCSFLFPYIFRTRTKNSVNWNPIYKIALVGAFLSLPLIPLLLFNDIHDRGPLGHITIVSEILNRTYPPRFPFFPTQVLRYHFGVDLFAAVLVSIFRMRVDWALSLITFFAWMYVVQLGAYLGRKLWAERVGYISAILLAFSGGFPILCPIWDPRLSFSWEYAQACNINNYVSNPPLVSYLFQPPFALGANLFLVIFILIELLRRRIDTGLTLKMRHSFLLLLFFAGISLCHIVVFLVGIGSLLVTTLVFFRRRSGFKPLIFVMLLSIPLARLSGGFFGRRDQVTSQIFPLAINGLGHARSILPSLFWNFATFGFLGLVGCLGLYKFRKTIFSNLITLCLGLCVLGGIIVCNFVHYKLSWDIVKFATLSSMGLSIFAAPMVIGLSNKRFFQVFFILVCAICPLGFAVNYMKFDLRAFRANELFRISSSWRNLGRSDQLAINYLRTIVKDDEIIWVRASVTDLYSMWGGIPTMDSRELKNSVMHGISESALQSRIDALSAPMNIAHMLENGAKYFVISSEDRLEGIDDALKARRIKLIAQFDPISIFAKSP